MKLKRIILSFILLFLGMELKAQLLPVANQGAPTPKTLEMIRYGQLPPDLNSGTVSFEIPVYTISDRDFSIPISLRYSSQGFQPARQTGDAGLHWTLLAGGMITREIVGVDDFSDTYGLHGGLSVNNDESLYQMTLNLNYIGHNTPEVLGNGRETCSDIYRFSFPGHSGSFVLSHDGHSFSVFNTNGGKGAYKVEYDSVFDCFTITTGDGFRYRFGHGAFAADDHSKEIRWYRSAVQPNEVACDFMTEQISTVTWLLDRIIAPNGRTVDFVYESVRSDKNIPQTGDDVLTTFYRKNPDVVDIDTGETDGSYKGASLTYTSYLKRIAVDSAFNQVPPVALSFVWYRPSDKELSGTPAHKYSALVQPKRRLSQISVYDQGTLIRHTTLGYTQSGTRPLLTSVSTDGFGSYTMSYYTDSSHPFPGILSNALDFWGYYNGKDATSDQSISPMGIYENLDEYIKNDFMNPDWNYSRLGLISQITYPTGGTTSITYEANRASKILLRTRYPGGVQPANPETFNETYCFLPSLRTVTDMLPTTECGGVRVASITDDDGIGTPSTRTFTYEKVSGGSSGIIQQFPRFFAGKVGPYPLFNAAIKFPGSSFDQLPVAYSRVTEHLPDSSYIVTTFSDWESDPDEYSPYRQYHGFMSGDSDTLFMNNILREPDSRAYRRGRPLGRKIYRNDNTLVRNETYSYADWGDGYSAYVVGSGDYWWSARRFLCDRDPVRLDVTDYPLDGGTPHTEFYEYGYDTNGLPNLERHGTGSMTEETRTIYSGTTTISGGVYDLMRSEGVVSLPVDREYWRGTQPVSGERTTYKRLDSLHYVPSAMYKAPIHVGDTAIVYDIYSEKYFESYDSLGNPLVIRSRDGTPSTYSWTMNGKYPGASFTNARNGIRTVTSHSIQTRTDNQYYNNVTSVTKTFTSDEAGRFSMLFENLNTDGSGITATLDGTSLRLLEIVDFQTNIPTSYEYMTLSLPAGTHTLVLTGKRASVQPFEPQAVNYNIPIKGTLTISYESFVDYQQTLDVTEVFYEDFEAGGVPGIGMDGSRGSSATFTRIIPHVLEGKYVLDWMRKNGDEWEYNRTVLSCQTDSLVVTVPATSTNPVDNIRFYPEGAGVVSWVWDGSFGMAASTDGRGVSEHYSYDNYGRLVQRSDNDGNPVEGWDYQFSPYASGNSYIRTRTYTQSSGSTYRQEYAFYDGLGRPFQTVMKGASPLPSGSTLDLATWTQYDAKGRPWRTWLPVSISTGTNHVGVTAFQGGSANTYGSNEEAWSETLYDGTPLEREISVTGPGKAWHDTGKSVSTEYFTNQDSAGPLACRKLTAVISGNTGMVIQKNGYYSAGELNVVRTTDEDGRVFEVFTDALGQTLLERRLMSGTASSSSSTWADTYYLYDAMGHLIAVIPPLLAEAMEESEWSGASAAEQEKQASLAYQYRYDSRGNLIAKKLPGADWMYLLYDLGDRLVLTQDGNLRSGGKWLFRAEDALGRECMTGLVAGTYDAFAGPLAYSRVVTEKTGDYSTLHGYGITGLSPSEANILSVNWWDDYAFIGEDSLASESRCVYQSSAEGDGFGTRYASSAKGLLTGSLRATLGNTGINGYLWSCLYYDAKGRLVQEHAAQAPQEMWTSTYFAYDFPGNIISRRTKHFRYSNTVADEVYTYDYDGWDRPMVTTHQLGTGPVKTLSSRTYDRVGRLSSESRNGGSTGLETAYSYNVRSWLTDISVGSSGNTFRQRLYYNEGRDGFTANSYQWGGNISRMDWKLNGEATDRTYQFGYDFLSRLTGAAFSGPSAYSDNFSRTYGYDANSNMTSRGGAVFAYDGNHLSTGTYDSNGNMTMVNGNTITYNLLNLPSMAVSSERTSYYTYTSDGEKVAKDVIEDNQITQTSYAGNLIAHFSSLEALLIEGGYVDLTGSAPAYRFYITDHQGNIRAVTDTTGTILHSNHYDPYGEEVLPIPVSGSQPASTAGADVASRYMYGSKEWDKELSLYDFSARYYAPEGAVSFTTMDPLCEKYYNISPYAYCVGNPMRYVEPLGMDFTERSQKYIDRLLISIEKRLSYNDMIIDKKQNRINSGGLSNKKKDRFLRQIEKLEGNSSELKTVRNEISILSASNQTYDIRRDDSMNYENIVLGTGEYRSRASYNFENGHFEIVLGDNSLGSLAHELKHAYQFEIGEYSTGYMRKGIPFYDKTDETAAYQRGLLFGGKRVATLPTLYDDLQDGPMDATKLNPIMLGDPSALQIFANRTKSAFRVNGVTYVMQISY